MSIDKTDRNIELMAYCRDAVFYRAHIFKFGLLVFSPNALWIQACILSNPTNSTSITFGQVSNIMIFELLFGDISFGLSVSNSVDLRFYCLSCYAVISDRRTPTYQETRLGCFIQVGAASKFDDSWSRPGVVNFIGFAAVSCGQCRWP
jgi:hypothetical protein